VSAARRRGNWCALLCSLGAGSAWCGQTGQPTDLSPDASTDSVSKLQEWQHVQTGLRESVWRLYAPTAVFGKDARGRTVSDDVNEWLMTPEVSARLQNIGTQAERQHQAGDEQAARATLQAGHEPVEEQWRRMALIGYYWEQKTLLDRHRELWRALLKLVPEPAAHASRVRLDALETALARDFSPTLQMPALIDEIEILKRSYNDERIQLAAIVSDQRDDERNNLASHERQTPCPAAMPEAADSGRPTGGGTRPVRVVSVPSAADFYPELARKSGMSGRVVLRLTIGETGCVQREQVIRTSGAPELDDAAMDMVEHMAFLPALQDGRAIVTRPSIPINFSLADPASR
jgi:TonB family protein